MHEAGHSKLVFWDNPEGWGGDRGGREVQDGVHMCTCGRFMSMHGKNHHNIAIILQLKLINIKNRVFNICKKLI